MPKPFIRLRGAGARKDQTWFTNDSLRVGRDTACTLQIVDESISRNHAEFVHLDQGWIVRDLGSTNGTLLNGLRLGRTDHKLRLGDIVQCGAIILCVEELVEDTAVRPACDQLDNFQVREVSRQGCRDAVESFALDVTTQLPDAEKLFGLLQIGQHLHKIDSLDDLLHASLCDVANGLKAQRGAILLVDRASGKLDLRAVFPDHVKTPRRGAYSSTLAHRCYTQGESLLCEEVANDAELSRARSIGDGAMGSVICVLLRSPRQKLGVMHLDRGIRIDPFTARDMRIADALAVTIAAGVEAALTLVDRQHSVFIQTVTALAQAVDCRDRYTGGHTQRVTNYALMLAEEMQISAIDIYNLQIGTPLHDIGKIGIDDAVLRKPGRLTPEEFEHIKTHPSLGADILQTIPQLASILPIVRNHHERWDGDGYPDRLAATGIPLLARIVTVADVFDAVTSARPYRAAMPTKAAFALIKNGMGTQFDPLCAEAFLRLQSRLTGMLESHEALPTTIPKSALATLVQEARASARGMTLA